MITWFELPYKARDQKGMEILLQGVYDDETGLWFIAINDEGRYGSVMLDDIDSGWRYNHKDRSWVGPDDPPNEGG